ncbi:MAG: hypothetical protein ACJA2N_001871 [Salibacteraceae bacterium]|jgi:hypothetical protein
MEIIYDLRIKKSMSSLLIDGVFRLAGTQKKNMDLIEQITIKTTVLCSI